MQPHTRKWLSRLALAILFGCALNAAAQYSSSIQGTVADSSGAVVPDADITLTNVDTKVTSQTHTNSSGTYRFLTLPAGNYVVAVRHQGFTEARTNVAVTADQVSGVNVKLIPGSEASVSVDIDAPILNPEETRTQYTLSEAEIRNLPNQNSALLGFIRLAPGSTGIAEGLNNLTENRSLPEANANGRDSASNLYTLDDVPITSSQNYASSYNGNVGGAIVFVPSTSAIGNVALQTTTFAVSYGSAASEVVAFNTKSGANRFHGIFDESYGDRVLNAYGYNIAHSGAQHRHIYSLGVGGPIFRDKTFFWGSYERRGELSSSGSGSGQYFTPQFSSFIANKANDPNQISVTNFIVNAPNTRALFVPSSADQTGAQYFGGCTGTATTTSYNTPCSMLVTENAIEDGGHFLRGKNYSLRVDQNFRGGKDRMYGFVYGMDQLSDSESIAPAFDGYTPTSGHAVLANETHAFSPNLLNQATFGYWQFRFDFTTTPHSQNLVDLPFLFLNIGVGNFTRFVPFTDTEGQYYGRDTLLYTKGKHNFNLGVEVAHNTSFDDRTGIYTRPLLYLWFSHQDFFDDKQDLIILSNYYSGATGKHIPSTSAAENTRYGIYFQDSWKIKPNLTLTYGLRYDDLGNPTPGANTIPFANIVSNVPNTTVRDVSAVKGLKLAAVNNAYASAQNLNIDPRFGFAWSPSKTDFSTVIRGGIGLYQDLANLENISGQVTSNPPGIIGYTGCCSGTVGYGTNLDASQGFGYTNVPISITPPTYNADGSVVGTQANIAGTAPSLKPQRSLLWDLSLEHEFHGKLVAALTYTGSHSYDLTYTVDLNRPNGTATNINIAANTETSTLANPNFGGVVPYLSGLVANSNALTAALRQNFRGLQWQASYNWEHILADPNGIGGNGNNGIVDSYNPHQQYGNAAFDVRNSFKISALLPINVHTENHLVQSVIGGWAVNQIFIGQTGEPFTVYYGNQSANTDFAASNKGFQIPNYVGTTHSFTRQQWKNGIFPVGNTAAVCGGLPAPCYVGFTRPTGAIGNEGYNRFSNAGYFTWDTNVQKHITLPWFRDQTSALTLRVDGFNIINRFNPSPIQLNQLGNGGGQAIDSGTGPFTTGANQARILQLGARFEF